MTSPALKTSFLPSLARIQGLALRHVYLYLGSWPRLLEMLYWPLINVALFGFISLSIMRHFSDAAVVTDAYLGGLLLNEVLLRSVMATLVMYMEEVWSRNLGHLFASPMRLRDFVAGLMTLSSVRCLLAVTPAFIVVAWLFDFSILRLGWLFPAYLFLLCFCGWWYGLMIVSLLLRFGLAAEWLGWMCTWLLMPFMAPYYPVSILPTAFRAVSWCLPGTYIFESMKIQLTTGTPRLDYLAFALVLNGVYFAAALLILRSAFAYARRNGGLLQMGE